MKNLSIYGFVNNQTRLGGLSGVKLAYAIAKNLKKATSEVENFEASRKPSEAYMKYDNARIELAKKYAKKDDKGEVIMTANGREFDIGDYKLFQEELEKLKEEYKEAYDEQSKKDDGFRELLNEDSTVEFYKVSLSELPEDITAEQMQILNLIDMVKEE